MFDLPLAELETYRPPIEQPEDLADFWRGSLAEVRRFDLGLSVQPVENKLAVIDTFDVRFAGWGGSEVRAWLHLPAVHAAPDRCRPSSTTTATREAAGFPHEHTVWAQAGYAQLVMDTRGQGWTSGGASGTADWAPEAGMIHTPGFLTAGLASPDSYYYRRVYCDALRLLEVAAALEQTDADRVIVTGRQPGRRDHDRRRRTCRALPAYRWSPRRRTYRSSATSGGRWRSPTPNPYAELTGYLAGWRDHTDTAYRTLSYFDGANLGRWATVPALFSVALMDEVCPPSTVFAAYHHYGADPQSPR